MLRFLGGGYSVEELYQIKDSLGEALNYAIKNNYSRKVRIDLLNAINFVDDKLVEQLNNTQN